MAPSSESSSPSPSSSPTSPPTSSSSPSSPSAPPSAFPPASAGSVFSTASSPSSSPSPAASPDPASPAHNPHLFAERFLPPPVDPSHVISSAAPSSLPIELPAIRADNCADDPNSTSVSSSSSSTPSDTSAPRSSYSSSSSSMAASTTTAISSSSQSAATYAANLRALSIFERWTLRASESQFNALAGAVGGFTAGVVTCPLDVIKTKLQAQGGFAALQRQQQAAAAAVAGTSSSATSASVASAASAAAGQNHHRLYNGLVGTARVIWRDEGIRGLYRGLGPIIMGYLPTWAVWFTVYNKSKLWMGERYHLQNTFVINFWSSVVAGASSTIVTNPIWVIKTRLMSQMPPSATPNSASAVNPSLATPWHYRSTIDAARKMYATEGILSFYSGLTPALLGLTHVAVQFPAYEYFKTKFTGVGMGESGSKGGSSDSGVEAPTHWLGVLSATILSKMLASSLTYPHEVIRTRLQTQRRQAAKSSTGAAAAAPRYRGVVTTFQMILKEEGWHAFYAGMGTNMMRAVPAATVTMLTYEYVMRELKRTRYEARRQLEQ